MKAQRFLRAQCKQNFMDWDQTAVQPSENHVSVTLIGKNTYTEHKNPTLEQWKQAILQDDAGSSGKKCEGLLQRA